MAQVPGHGHAAARKALRLGRQAAAAPAAQGGQPGGYNQPAPQNNFNQAPAQPMYNEPPMDFDDDIPF